MTPDTLDLAASSRSLVFRVGSSQKTSVLARNARVSARAFQHEPSTYVISRVYGRRPLGASQLAILAGRYDARGVDRRRTQWPALDGDALPNPPWLCRTSPRHRAALMVGRAEGNRASVVRVAPYDQSVCRTATPLAPSDPSKRVYRATSYVDEGFLGGSR